MDSNSAPNNLHCTTVIVSYMKLAVGQELVTFYILHLDLQLYCITDLVYCSVTVKICHIYCHFTLHHIGLQDNLAEVEEGPFFLRNKRKPFVQW